MAYVNRMAGPIEIKNTTDEKLKVKLIDPDPNNDQDTSDREEVSFEKNDKSFKINTSDKFIVDALKDSTDIAHFLYDGSEKVRIDTGGTIHANSYTQKCSIAYKENIKPLDLDLVNEFIDKIDIKSFIYKNSKTPAINLIIEECIQAGIPYQEHLFIRDDEGQFIAVDMGSLLGLTIASLKEEKHKREELEKRLERLERIVIPND